MFRGKATRDFKVFFAPFSLFPQKAKLVNGLTTGWGGSGADECQQLYESQPRATSVGERS